MTTRHYRMLFHGLALAAWALLFGVPVVGGAAPWLALALMAGAFWAMWRQRRASLGALVASFCVVAAAVTFGLSNPGGDRAEERWRIRETARIQEVLAAVGERVRGLEDLSSAVGKEAAVQLRSDAEADSVGRRLEAFRILSDRVRAVADGGQLPPGAEIGIQFFNADGTRAAWAGWPQVPSTLEQRFLLSGQEVLYTRQVSLYQILTHIIPIPGPEGRQQGTLVIDIPLEVNYKVNNKFLKSTSFATTSSGAAAEVRFDYFAAPIDLPETVERRAALPDAERTPTGNLEPIGTVSGDAASGLSGRAIVRSALGTPLMTVTVTGRPLRFSVQAARDRYQILENTLLLAALAVWFGMSLRAFPRRFHGPRGAVKALYLLAFFGLVRYWMLWYRPATLGQTKLFDPAVFATPMLGGLMRSTGDLLVTAVFFMAAVYGILKITRGERPGDDANRRPSFPVALGRSVAGTLILIGVYELATRFIGSLVVNANPRLVGETMRLFDPYTALLHLSAFLILSGIFLAGMILIWGIGRFGRAGAVRVSAITIVLSILVSPILASWVFPFLAVLLIAFAVLAPRVVQREDLVSIVIVAFGFVLIVSVTSYVFLNDEYQALRRTFIQERVAELTDPTDNWRVFVLEDVLEGFSQDQNIRLALARRAAGSTQRLAFDLWAESSLSLLGYSSAIHVLNAADSVISRFSVEMPYRVRLNEPGERTETTGQQEWVVLDLETDTPRGKVRFYRGIVEIADVSTPFGRAATRTTIGKVIVDMPFFFESLSWAARTGRQTPELLRNVQQGGIEPRLEEPEALLLARLQGSRVVESSSDVLPVGFAFESDVLSRALRLKWPLLGTSGPAYRIVVLEADEPGTHLLAGFPVPGPLQHLLRWSTIFSLYFFYAVAIILLLIALKSLPLLKDVMPTLTPGRRLGFQQKLLGSFLLIALFPAIFLGVFSIGLIKNRFVQENRKEALQKAFSALKSLDNRLLGELRYLLEHTDIHDLLGGRIPRAFSMDPRRVVILFDETGTPVVRGAAEAREPESMPLPGASLEHLPAGIMPFDVDEILGRFPPEQMFLHRISGRPYVAVISRPVRLTLEEGSRFYFVYYGRMVTEDLLGEIADEVAADVNLYDGGELIASSREGLLSGGFISSMMNAEAFVEVSVMDVDQTVVGEKAGRYRYEVAYLPIQSVMFLDNAAIGVPLLFRPESYHVEVQKATSIVLGIFALLSAATIGIGLLLARGIFEPLKRLLEGTRRIGQGDLSFKLPGQRRDEIGTVVTAFNDMTHKLSVSQATLEERRRYLEVILANIGTGVLSTDEHGRILALNNAGERILGLEQGQVLNRHPRELVEAGMLPAFFSLLDGEAASQLLSSEIDVELHGHRRTVKYVQTQVQTNERYMGTVMVFEDLTELINSKKLSAWVEMARQIAHEIKNPLTPIKLSTQFMVRAHEEKAEDFDRIFRESADTVMQQVEVLRRIATEFSSFGRLQQLNLGRYDIVEQVEKIVAPYRRNHSGVSVSFEHGDALYATVDTEALRKICTNLIENAMEAMPHGGSLRITCGGRPNHSGEQVWVSFTDSGPGLNEDVAGKLFEPYFSTKTTGTGLGLAICRTLSREMGGDVDVENLADGSGVRAMLYLRGA